MAKNISASEMTKLQHSSHCSSSVRSLPASPHFPLSLAFFAALTKEKNLVLHRANIPRIILWSLSQRCDFPPNTTPLTSLQSWCKRVLSAANLVLLCWGLGIWDKQNWLTTSARVEFCSGGPWSETKRKRNLNLATVFVFKGPRCLSSRWLTSYFCLFIFSVRSNFSDSSW